MTAPTPAERAAQLADQADQIATRRLVLASDVVDLERQAAELGVDAADAAPGLLRHRAQLGAAVGVLTRARTDAVVAGSDVAEVTQQLIAKRLELELADADLAVVQGMAATVDAQLARERRLAELKHLLAEVVAADQAVNEWQHRVPGMLAEAVAAVRQAAADLAADVGAVRAVADRADAIRRQAANLAAELGVAGPPAGGGDPVEAAVAGLPADQRPTRRLLLAASRCHPAGILTALADAGL